MQALLADSSFRAGFRLGIPVAIAGAAVGLSFGVLARPVMGDIAPIVMSAIVFAGSAQFGSVAVLAAGGGPAAAIIAGILLNSRYVPMGVALAPSLTGGRLRRVLEAQTMVDYSWAAAMRGGGRFDVRFMMGATAPMYVGWIGGTALGVLAGDLIGDSDKLGLDAVFPAFFLALLLGTDVGTSTRATLVAIAGGLIALALVPFTPPGVPIIAACSAALIGLDRGKASCRRRGGRARAGRRAPADPGAGGRPMSDAAITIAFLAVTSFLIRASGPLLVGGRTLPPRFIGVIDLLAPALLTALIVVEVFGGDQRIEVTASLAGVLAGGGVLLWRRSALLTAIIVAASVTALLRALG